MPAATAAVTAAEERLRDHVTLLRRRGFSWNRIASVLGVRGEGSDLVDRLTSVMSGQHLLVVLDNFERVIDATHLVSGLLAKVPGLKVLATSRTPLHAYGEREYPLAPLPLPDPTHLPSVESLSQYEAVRLFIERAQAVIEAFKANTGAGVVGVNGEMLDRPHLLRAERLMKRAGKH